MMNPADRFLLTAGSLLLLLSLWGAPRAVGQAVAGSTIALRSELADLHVLKTRLLCDLRGDRARWRLLYAEKRCGSDPFLQPQEACVGAESPVLTAGPLSLQGFLAQLYNPLAHGPGSDVFGEPAGLGLDIDMDVASRRGVCWSPLPGTWDLFVLDRNQEGAQLGSALLLPLGSRCSCQFGALLAAPPQNLEGEEGWYYDKDPYPGGQLCHVAGAFLLDRSRLELCALGAASGGQRVQTGTLSAVHLKGILRRWRLELLLGRCSPRYFTPEGRAAAIEWIGAAEVQWRGDPLQLSAGCRREIHRRESRPPECRKVRDTLEGCFQLSLLQSERVTWSIEGSGELALLGLEPEELELGVQTELAWHPLHLRMGLEAVRQSASGGCTAVELVLSHDPSWGSMRLSAGIQQGAAPGFRAGAAFELLAGNSRLYLRMNNRNPLPWGGGWGGEEFFDYYSFTMGGERTIRREQRSAL